MLIAFVDVGILALKVCLLEANLGIQVFIQTRIRKATKGLQFASHHTLSALPPRIKSHSHRLTRRQKLTMSELRNNRWASKYSWSSRMSRESRCRHDLPLSPGVATPWPACFHISLAPRTVYGRIQVSSSLAGLFRTKKA